MICGLVPVIVLPRGVPNICNVKWPYPQASSEPEGAGGPLTGMSTDDARTILGLRPDAKFDEAMDAKNRMLRMADGDMDRQMQIEVAYDVLLMDSMKKRMSGEVVSSAVRFADVERPAAKPSRKGSNQGQVRYLAPPCSTSSCSACRVLQRPPPQVLLPSLPGGGLQLRPSTGQDLTQQAVLFGALALWTLVQGMTDAPGVAPSQNVPGLQLALGLAASVYFLKERKGAPLGKAIGIAVARWGGAGPYVVGMSHSFTQAGPCAVLRWRGCSGTPSRAGCASTWSLWAHWTRPPPSSATFASWASQQPRSCWHDLYPAPQQPPVLIALVV